MEHKAAVAQEWEAEGLLDSSMLGDDCEQRGACWRESAAGCDLKCISQMIQRKLHYPHGCSAPAELLPEAVSHPRTDWGGSTQYVLVITCCQLEEGSGQHVGSEAFEGRSRWCLHPLFIRLKIKNFRISCRTLPIPHPGVFEGDGGVCVPAGLLGKCSCRRCQGRCRCSGGEWLCEGAGRGARRADVVTHHPRCVQGGSGSRGQKRRFDLLEELDV